MPVSACTVVMPSVRILAAWESPGLNKNLANPVF